MSSRSFSSLLRSNTFWTVFLIALFVVFGAALYAMGRLPWCACGLKLWTGDAWGSASSQHFADPYSTSHFIHGILFFAILVPLAAHIALRWRVSLAMLLEMGWEILENSPLIINRYRVATASLGYTGDTILNSVGDVLFMLLGFWMALRLPWKWSAALVILIECVMLLLYRDNLTLNILMLLTPIDAVRQWQMGA